MDKTTPEVCSEEWRSYATMCRLCLQKDGFMLGIFNNMQGKDKSIHKKIIDCTALPVKQGDGLPNVICHKCLFKIEFCLEFRQLCFISDATLRHITGLAKDNGFDQIAPIYEELFNGGDENVVMVVDPNSMDYESDCESEDKQSDAEINELDDGRNVFMCRYCDHAFTDQQECSEHETQHNSEKPYRCSTCSMNFADRLVFSAHMKNVHKNDKPFNCPQCDRTFARRSDLRKHTIVHTGVKPFTCPVCSKSFSRNTNLSKHMRIHSGAKPFSCPKCPRTFISRTDLNRHSLIHSGQKPFRCSYCNLSFGRRDLWLRHEKRHWPEQNAKDKSEELQMLREDVNNEFNKQEENIVINLDPFNHNEFSSSETNLRNLSESEPKPEPKEPKPDPGESVSSDNLQDDKPYKCNTCPKTFSTPDNLKYHMARHTGIRPFSCHVCSKSFIRKRELDRHVVTHTGLKPFKCPKCTKSFGRKDKLVRHMRIHDRREGLIGKKHFNSGNIRKPLFLQKQQEGQK